MDFLEFLHEEEIIVENGILKFRNRRRRARYIKDSIPRGTPHIINEICDTVDCLHMHGISVTQVDFPVLIAFIQRNSGYGKKWSYIIAKALIDIAIRFS